MCSVRKGNSLKDSGKAFIDCFVLFHVFHFGMQLIFFPLFPIRFLFHYNEYGWLTARCLCGIVVVDVDDVAVVVADVAEKRPEMLLMFCILSILPLVDRIELEWSDGTKAETSNIVLMLTLLERREMSKSFKSSIMLFMFFRRSFTS